MRFRDFAAVDVDPGTLKSIYADFESWPRWVPQLKSLRVVQRRPGGAVIETCSKMMGTEFRQTSELEIGDDTVRQQQITGRFKRYEAQWKLLPSPQRGGTTIGFTLELDLGRLGSFVPQRRLTQSVSDWFGQMVRNAEHEARRSVAAPPAATRPAHPPSEQETIVQVFQTAQGLEVKVMGRTYCIPPQ